MQRAIIFICFALISIFSFGQQFEKTKPETDEFEKVMVKVGGDFALQLQAIDHEAPVELIDLPGLYALTSANAEEEVARDVLLDHASRGRQASAAIVVVDATNLARNLYLAGQVRELGVPLVERAPRKVMLTPAGREAAERAQARRWRGE